MIDIQNVKKDYAGTTVLDGASARISRGEKVALIGGNGAGKTTLLRILMGEDDDWSGKIARENGVRAAFVPQFFPEFDGTALEFVLEPYREARERLASLEEEMASADGKALERALDEYGALRAEYDSGDGDLAEERARRYLDGAGLGKLADTKAKVLSGGERNALALTRALLGRPDLLVLDEPGNHLDAWGLSWLERCVRDYPGAVLIVSHNRYLLDRTVSRVLELEAGKIESYTGNYSAYRMERLRKAVAGEMDWRADQKRIARLEELVKRFETIARAHPDPKWGRRLRARRTQLEKTRERSAEKPRAPDAKAGIAFGGDRSRADIALKVTEYSKSFGDARVLEAVSLTMEPGDRVALVGPNGSGKTTFLEAVLREGTRDGAGSSAIAIGPSMRVSYCSQHGDALDRNDTVLGACVKAGAKTADEAWKALSPLLFSRESLERKVDSLSGGETNRLQLALASISRANFLVLDEPTNHLDIPSREAVEDALADFDGTILVVSHDRYFLDRIATRVVEIDDGEFVEYDGNFSEFWYRRYGDASAGPFKSAKGGDPEGRGKSIERAKEAARKRATGTKPDAMTAATHANEIERRIMALEDERTRIEKDLSNAYERGDLRAARDLGGRLADNARIVERLYDEWK